MIMINMRGDNMGKVNLRKVYQGVAPSTVAASNASLGRLLRPASKTNIEKGVHCQDVRNMMEIIAMFLPHQLILGKPIIPCRT